MPKKENIALLTSCSVTRNFDPIVKISDAPVFDHMQELAAWWIDRMERDYDGQEKTPGELYAGISFTAVTEMAQTVGHDNIFIVTGGIGLGRHTDAIVPYDFTADKKAAHNAHQHVTGEKFLPHLWWNMVNTGFSGDGTPIASLLETHEYVVGALPKMFIKYITADLASCSPGDRQNRIFIPIPRSMIGSVPMALRDAFVPYGPAYAEDVSFSRVDKPQRIAQKFLAMSKMSSFGSHSEVIAGMVAEAPTRKDIDYADMFTQHPEILEVSDAGTALSRVKQLGLKPGGKSKFAGAWRSAKGPQEVTVTDEDREVSGGILKDLLSRAKPLIASNEEAILEKLGIFLVTLEEADPKFIFTAADVVTWGKAMYDEDALLGLDNTNKVAYTLLYNAEHLGLNVLESNGKKVFQLKSAPVLGS